ncbi:MAG: LPXTG cell wall anchor domain-containing protein [Chloroflexota bacterium]
MAVPNSRSLSAEHSRHDRLLVARFAVGDVEGAAQLHEAQVLVKRCSECAALVADITSISSAVAKMPAPARTKDFRLTAQEADHLRGSRFDRFLRTLTGSSWSTVRPVAAVALSVGLVMSVVGAMPLLGAVGAAAPLDSVVATQQPIAVVGNPTPKSTDTLTGPDAAAGATPPSEIYPVGQGSVTALGTAAGDNLDNAYLNQQTSAPELQEPGGGVPAPQASAAADGSGRAISTPLPATSSSTNGALLVAGVVVSLLAALALAALYVARRRYSDPLLR